jgi:uncharacterized membrane protein YoaK (UPF0700 family)
MADSPSPAKPSYLRGYVADSADGPLLGLLLLLTVTTGMVDAVTILRLGRVFTANMTGNSVFVGLGLIRAPGFLLAASLMALVAFLAGAFAGGRIAQAAEDRARLLRATTSCQLVLVLATIVITALAVDPIPAGPRTAAIACLAFSFGIQNAAVNVLKVPDETTTVVTRTLAALMVDLGRAPGPVLLRRALSWSSLLAGAMIGGLVVLHTSVPLALTLVLVVQLTVIVVVATRPPAPWMTAHSRAATSAKTSAATE